MADRKNLSRNLGRGVGSAIDSTDTSYFHDNGDGTHDESVAAHQYYWTGSAWAKVTSSGGGGGAVTIADGADVAQGATTDASTANTVIGRLKKLISLLPTALGQTTMSASLPVVVASDQSAILTKLTNGTNTADVIAGDSGNNGVVISGSRKEVTGTTTTAQAICSTDVSNYSYVCVQFTATGGSATNAFQASNDNTNWVNAPLVRASQLSNTATMSGTTGDLYFGPVPGRYFRISVTGIVSGSTTAVVEFSTIPHPLHTMGVSASQSGTWTAQIGNTPNTTAILATEPRPATPTLTNVSTSNSNATLLASNTSRRHAVIVNESSVVLYVKFGATASATSYTYALSASAILELPFPVYTGQIDGILASSTGTARVTEIV